MNADLPASFSKNLKIISSDLLQQLNSVGQFTLLHLAPLMKKIDTKRGTFSERSKHFVGVMIAYICIRTLDQMILTLLSIQCASWLLPVLVLTSCWTIYLWWYLVYPSKTKEENSTTSPP